MKVSGKIAAIAVATASVFGLLGTNVSHASPRDAFQKCASTALDRARPGKDMYATFYNGGGHAFVRLQSKDGDGNSYQQVVEFYNLGEQTMQLMVPGYHGDAIPAGKIYEVGNMNPLARETLKGLTDCYNSVYSTPAW